MCEKGEIKNIVILGGAYAGASAILELVNSIPDDYRIILIDRNSHGNHLYVMPRFAVMAGYEHEAFIPYSGIFGPNQTRHLNLQTAVLSLSSSPRIVTISQSFPAHNLSTEIPYEYCLYSLGASLPGPINIWEDKVIPPERTNGGVRKLSVATKRMREGWMLVDRDQGTPESVFNIDAHSENENSNAEPSEIEETTREELGGDAPDDGDGVGSKAYGIKWLKDSQERIKDSKAESFLIIGGGALGVQFAGDIKSVHPEKKVILLHSRNQLLPIYRPEFADEIMKFFSSIGVAVHLNTRLDLSTVRPGSKIFKSTDGRTFEADRILLCTGQVPHSEILKKMAPETVDPVTKAAGVLRSMQLAPFDRDRSLKSLESIKQRRDGLGEKHIASITDAVEDLSLNESVLEKSRKKEEANSTEKEEQEAIGTTPYPRIFVAGDVADAFGAIKAGHTAYYQAHVAAHNILKLINGAAQEDLERYEPGLPAIKVTLGVGKGVYQANDEVHMKLDDPIDLDAPLLWPFWGADPNGPGGMHR